MAQKKRRKILPKPPATRLLLIRHGEVEARYQGIFGGRIDMNLSPRGKRQAKVLANYLRGKTIDAIYASPMKRVQQTLPPTLKNNRLKQTNFPRPSHSRSTASSRRSRRRSKTTASSRRFFPACARLISATGPD